VLKEQIEIVDDKTVAKEDELGVSPTTRLWLRKTKAVAKED